jgi:hypothetical protein
MKYTKPQVTLLVSATDAIQSDQEKLIKHTPDYLVHPTGLGTSAAYEADE